MQRIFQRTESVNPHVLAMVTVLIAYAILLMPSIVVVYEEFSPSPSDDLKIAYIHDNINSISECSPWVKVQWANKLWQGIFIVLSKLGFVIIFLPVVIAGFRYLQQYRPRVVNFFIFIVLVFVVPILLYLLLRSNEMVISCAYVPSIEVKSVYPSLLALFIWLVNLILCTILYHKTSIDFPKTEEAIKPQEIS